MHQEELMDLLREAGNLGCSEVRRRQIWDVLNAAAPSALAGDGTFKLQSPEAGMRAVLDQLWKDTVLVRPEYLPKLFPAFAILCGDRHDSESLCSTVDWGYMHNE